jgi:hypothetical protein
VLYKAQTSVWLQRRKKQKEENISQTNAASGSDLQVAKNNTMVTEI